jgi:asparagine synthase (glutamine-hydrolysing)
MCGIAGIFAYGEAPPVDEAELLRIREHMARRGPDGAGLWLSQDRRAGFGHRRLSIIDLAETGAQPMRSADGRFVINYNGEIYNYKALRRELEAAGAAFRSTSDTEVLLHLFAREGAGMLGKLRGMYAFSIWDAAERRLFLARDPFGIKPLYYADDGRTLRYASQVRALAAGKALDLAPDPAGRAGFLLWGFVPEPFTLYRRIQALPAGCWMTVDANGAGLPKKFFDLAAEYRQAEERAAGMDAKAAMERLGGVLADSVAHHMVADVPVSVFLSSGIDSSAIAALAARGAGSDLRCVTLGFEEYRGGPNDETPLAAETARRLGARHDIDWIGKQAFYDEIPDVMEAMDQPSIDGINTWFVARAAARQKLKVALSGLGGDELFLGYPSFQDVPRMVRAFGFTNRLPGWAGRSFRAIAAPVLRQFTSPKYAGLPEYGGSHEGAYLLRRGLYMPWELPGLLGREMAREGCERLQTVPSLRATREGVRAEPSIVSCLELAWYMRGQLLRDADWAGMAHSLEIRVPFVDTEVLRAAAPFAAAGAIRSKRDFAALPALGLPPAVIDKPKTGFLVPVREWLNDYAPARNPERRLRGWANKVFRHFTGRRSYLNLVTEAYGGHGGIALYNRDFLSAMCGDPATGRVVAIPRLVPNSTGPLPSKLRFDTSGLNGKFRYAAAVARAVLSGERIDLVVCGHVNLLPIAVPAAALAHAPLVLLIYGIDVWHPTRSRLANLLARRADAVFAISQVTLERFLAWSGVARQKCAILPNAIHLDRYGPGPKGEALLKRYGIDGRTVIMTLGRLNATERYKGMDEVLEAMPGLVEKIPDLAYLIAGDGSDRSRLEGKAAALGLKERVIFTGHIAESEKADHYRLADAFVMPSSGEGFGFVFLEAMACGIPAIGSRTDGGREALREGSLGRLVDPGNAAELDDAILNAVREPKRVPEGIEYFSFENFERRCRRLMARTSMLAG